MARRKTTPPHPAVSIGARVKQAREALGWSQVKLAEKLGLSGPRVAAIESGPFKPKADLIGRLARALEVAPSQLDPELAHSLDATRPKREISLRPADVRGRWKPLSPTDDEQLRQIGADRVPSIADMIAVAAEHGIAVTFRGDLPAD